MLDNMLAYRAHRFASAGWQSNMKTINLHKFCECFDIGDEPAGKRLIQLSSFDYNIIDFCLLPSFSAGRRYNRMNVMARNDWLLYKNFSVFSFALNDFPSFIGRAGPSLVEIKRHMVAFNDG